MACLLFVWVSAFPLFFRDVYKKERKAALCECKAMAFLYGVQYLNVGIFCVFAVYIFVYASFPGDSRELKWCDALFCGYYSRFAKNAFACEEGQRRTLHTFWTLLHFSEHGLGALR